ncbi:hypothetical protein HY643_04825 [Candidatus Woesearchaeota archaeon]|nr:hypothetical protein [Candidatus Woesearchaeota archaeon]
MPINFNQIIAQMESTGFYEVILPFLLVFALFFATLQKVQIFGRNSKNYNVVIALVTALLAVRVPQVVQTMNNFLPRLSIVVLLLMMLLMVLGIFGSKAEGWSGGWFALAAIFSIIAVLWAFFGATTYKINLPQWLRLDAANAGSLIGVAIFFILIYFVLRTGNNGIGGKIAGSFGPDKIGRRSGGEEA